MAKTVLLGDLISPAPLIRCGDDRLPVLSMTMHDGIVLQSDRFKKNLASLDQSNYKVVKRGQLVVGFPIDEGVLYVQNVADAGIMSPAYNVWNISKVLPRFLELSLHSPMAMQYYKDNLRGTTARRRSIPVEALLSLPLFLPAMEEQQRIVSVIDELSDLISLRKQQLDKLDELIKARFVEMFEGKYPMVAIGDKFNTTSGGTPSKSHKEFYENGTIPWLTSGAVNTGIICSVKTHISEEGLKNSSAKMIPENSIVIAMYGATAGQAGLLRIKTTTNQAVCSILPNPNYIPEYLYYAVKSKKDWMTSQCAGGAQPNISQSIIKKMQIIDAPLDFQKSFATFFARAEKSKLTIQQSLNKLEVLKKTLMQEYFG